MKDLINNLRTADIRKDKEIKESDKRTQKWLKMKNE